MNILDQIIANKKKEVEERMTLVPIKDLEGSVYFSSPVRSLKRSLLNESSNGIIAEFKRKSPSKGIINKDALVEQTIMGYERARVSALSILTDMDFFGGKNEDVTSARKVNTIPILRKEFIVDEYQIIEAKAIGADAILLLANVLSAREIKQFATTAKFLGMEILLEVRDKEELQSVNILIDCIGVNNRNLKDFTVDVKRSFDMVNDIPKGFMKVSESGIDSAKTIYELKKAGFNGFLIGETFMKRNQPEVACADFIKEVTNFKPSK
jgi:indole-3-glycerol phosphate synthase